MNVEQPKHKPIFNAKGYLAGWEQEAPLSLAGAAPAAGKKKKG